MSSASYQLVPSRERGSGRRSVTAAVLTLLAHLLLLLGLLTLTPAPDARKTESRLTAFDLREEPPSAPKHAPHPEKRKSVSAAAHPPPPSAPPPAATPVRIPSPFPALVLSREEFAAADISKLPSHGTGSAADKGESGAAEGQGQGPGGARLYNAEWYREPTHAELAYYLPQSGVRTGWGMIACKTVARFHVEDCRQLDETPGSGLARAIRQAAWQFLVRPPRIDGKPILGAWVRIRVDFTQDGAKASGG